jgi:type II secretory pathway component PulJ
MPGESVRFSAVTYDEAVHSARIEARAVEALLERRSAYRSRPRRSAPARGNWQVVVDGVAYDVRWEEIRP